MYYNGKTWNGSPVKEAHERRSDCHSLCTYLPGIHDRVLPGFAYMGAVDQRIAVPRHAAPRTNVKAGSVGIAGSQTGIYPFDSPGGWQLIGQTPLKLFNANKIRFASLHRATKCNSFPSAKKNLKRNMSIRVLKQGIILASVQSLSRNGYRHLGIGSGEQWMLSRCRWPMEMKRDAAVIEMHFPAPEILFWRMR